MASLRADRSNRLGWPVRLVLQGAPRTPKTSSSGGTPSKLEDLGLLWGRPATQNTLEPVEMSKEQQLGFGKVRVWRGKSKGQVVLIRLVITSIGRSIYIYRPGKTYNFTNWVTKWFLNTNLPLFGLQLARPVWPVGPTSQTGRPQSLPIFAVNMKF